MFIQPLRMNEFLMFRWINSKPFDKFAVRCFLSIGLQRYHVRYHHFPLEINL